MSKKILLAGVVIAALAPAAAFAQSGGAAAGAATGAVGGAIVGGAAGRRNGPAILRTSGGSESAGSGPVAGLPGQPGAQARPGHTPTGEKIGRNDACWCGSGRKYKKCHGA